MTDHWTLEALARIGAAILCGIVLGIEREAHGRAAGLRTIVLVCVAAAVAMVLSERLFQEAAMAAAGVPWRPDPARLAAGVLTGIGFIGAGTIVRHGHLVRGVTTASVIWLAAITGLCCGAGSYLLAGVATTAGMTALMLLPRLEALADNDWYADLELAFDGVEPPLPALSADLVRLGVKVKKVSLAIDRREGSSTVRLSLKLKRCHVAAARNRVADLVAAMPGVRRMVWDA